MSGVFQVDRSIFEHNIWNNPTEFRLFFYILGNAVWKKEGTKIGDVVIGRGQYLRSYRNLREDLMYMENNTIKHYGIATIKRTVDKLVEDGRLKTEETELGTLFTVVNYSNYQGFDRFQGEDSEQQRNTNGTLTEQQRNNKKNVKKVKNVNKDIYSPAINYLNEKANKNYKATTKKTQTLIDARVKEGHTLEDFYKVIDNKVKTWLGTEWEKYLRPATLFNGDKFEGYLNEDTRVDQKAINHKTKFHMTEQRTDNYTNDELEEKLLKKRLEARKKNRSEEVEI